MDMTKKNRNIGMEFSALKTEFRPSSKTQTIKLAKSFGSSRFVYNDALKTAQRMLDEKAAYPNFQALRNDLNARKREDFPWLLEVPKDIASEACRDLETALKNFFESRSGKRKGPKIEFPKKKKKGKAKDSFRLPGETVKILEEKDGKISKIKIGKLGVVRLLEPIKLSGWHVSSVTVSRKANRHFISFCVRRPENIRTRRVLKPLSIGVDLGIKTLVAYSNKTVKEGPKALKKGLKKLIKLQKRMSKKYMPPTIDERTNEKTYHRQSSRYMKAKKKVANHHLKIANVRKDFLEKETTRLALKYDLILVEDLNVAGMKKNRKLARAISDQAFGRFVSTLERKQLKYGNHVVRINTWFPSSKQCRKCGTKNHGLTLADRIFLCVNPKCGHTEHRDHHAAINVQQEGLKIYAKANAKLTLGETKADAVQIARFGSKPSQRTEKGTTSSSRDDQKKSPEVKYTELQNPYLIRMLRKQ